MKRRDFLTGAAGLAMGSTLGCAREGGDAPATRSAKSPAGAGLQLEDFYRMRFLQRELFPEPVIIRSLDLYEIDGNWFARAEAENGAVGWAIGHVLALSRFFPLFVKDIAPFFVGKDARDIEALVDGVYEHKAIYKLQGQALWICVATAEFAVLDLLGRVAHKPTAELLGGIIRPEIPLYRANNHREHDAEESLRRIVKSVDKIGAKAVKIKVGGRMRREDSLPGRTEALIPMVAEALGDRCVMFADANSSYTVEQAIRIGRMLEDNGYKMFEEPVPFDFLEETKMVADALNIQIAGGEQESSLWRFWWLIEHGAVGKSQPDLFYFGGLIRSLRVAKMSEAAGIECTPHISGSGMGFLYMGIFASCAPALGPYQEFKGVNRKIPWESPGVDFTIRDGTMPAPKGVGNGVNYDPEYLAKATLITG